MAGSAAVWPSVEDPVTHGRFQAGEGEIAGVRTLQRPGQVEAPGVTLPRQPFHRRAARIAEAQHLRDLVERLADRIVDRGAEEAIATDALHRDQLAMPARDQEQQVGKLGPGHEAGRQRVRLEMVDRDQRQVVHQRDGLAGEQAHHQARRSARARPWRRPPPGRGTRSLPRPSPVLPAGPASPHAPGLLSRAPRRHRGRARRAGRTAGPPGRGGRRAPAPTAVSSQLVSMPRTMASSRNPVSRSGHHV